VTSHTWHVEDYDLRSTLNSGQAFYWRQLGEVWEGVIGRRWVMLSQRGSTITATSAGNVSDWAWVEDYLQLRTDIGSIIATFPKDPPMNAALRACRGLRLLRQDPWEVLGSFILSSTKQIVQIKQVVAALRRCFGEPVRVPAGHGAAFAFPRPERLAAASEARLRACKMGFRAPYLKAAAEAVASGSLDLEKLAGLPVDQARALLEELPGVGPKVADCILLSAWNYPTAFPLDVWVLRALKDFYFKGKRPTLGKLREFSQTHFGEWSGYAQLYLFHYIRVHLRRGLK